MSDLLRLYGPDELIGPDSYPYSWHQATSVAVAPEGYRLPPNTLAGECPDDPPIKDLIRELAGHRCERCGHPYPPGIALTHQRGEWTPCDVHCDHLGPRRSFAPDGVPSMIHERVPTVAITQGYRVEAQWRILTVHHLNGVKWDCRWWNLAALCQRCHLAIQAKVVMERVYPFEHTEWFKPHAAGWYAADYLGEDLTREETMARLDELLVLERVA